MDRLFQKESRHLLEGNFMIKEKKPVSSLPKKTLIVQDFPINKIRIDPQKRYRQEQRDYENNPKYIALKRSMIKFGLRNAISINTDYMLVEGFWRYNAALDLGWEEIPTIIDYLPEKDAKLLEFQENFIRRDFTPYEIYTGTADLKREHEKDYPESKRGKYDRSSKKNHDHDNIIPSDGNMINNLTSFVEAYGPILGLRKTALYEKVKIGEAILDGTYNSKTIKAILDEKITQNQLLTELKHIENRNSNKNNLEPHNKASLTSRNKASKISIENSASNKKLNEKKSQKEKTSNSASIKITPIGSQPTIGTADIKKMEQLVKLSLEDREIDRLLKRVRSGNLFLDQALDMSYKIIELKKEVRANSINDFVKAGHNLDRQEVVDKKNGRVKKESGPKKIDINSQDQNSIQKKYLCKICPKATVIAIICEMCGHPTSKVLCDYDMTNGSRKLRNPDLELCKNSPDYDLILRSSIRQNQS